MNQRTDSKQRFAISRVPEPRSQSLRLPDGILVQLNEDRLIEGWRIEDAAGFKQDLTALSYIAQSEEFLTEEDIVLQEIDRYGLYQRRALQYAGFVIDYFYLQRNSGDIIACDYAARLCHLLIRFWQHAVPEEQASFALPMLWRTYWRALYELIGHSNEAQYATVIQSWRKLGLQNEYLRALRHWQAICLQDEHAWFFAELLHAWVHPSTHHWQETREREVNHIVWETGTLRPPGTATFDGQNLLRELIQRWYLPRYDIKRAQLIQAELDRTGRGRAAWLLGPHSLGLQRFWAGIILGFIAVAIPGDVWKIINATKNNIILHGTIILIGIGIAFYYLAAGIYRKTQVRPWRRTIYILWPCEILSLVLGLLTTIAVAPLQLNCQLSLIDITLLTPAIAQFALFIGIFTQLLFDDKPSTAPLDAP